LGPKLNTVTFLALALLANSITIDVFKLIQYESDGIQFGS